LPRRVTQFTKEVGKKPVEHRLTTSALQVEACMPPGAENLPGLIAAHELCVNQTKNLLPSALDESRAT